MKTKVFILAAVMTLAVLTAVPVWAVSATDTVTVNATVNVQVGVKVQSGGTVSFTIDPIGSAVTVTPGPEIWFFLNNPSSTSWSATATAAQFTKNATNNISVNNISVVLTDTTSPLWAPITYILVASSPVTIKSTTSVGWSGWKKSTHAYTYTPSGLEMADSDTAIVTYTMTAP